MRMDYQLVVSLHKISKRKIKKIHYNADYTQELSRAMRARSALYPSRMSV